MKKHLMLVGACLAGLAVLPQAKADVDPNLPTYEQTAGVSGNLSSIGSDTLNNLMTLWAEEFNKFYPNVNIQIQGAGTSTAPPAVTEGTANFGPMSRGMREGEVQAFEERHGYPPTLVPVAIDLLAVYVHRDNPVEGLSLPEVDAIFSSTRRCGASEDITRWGQVGLDGAWENRDITLYSRNAVSGTYGFFRQNALCDGDFKDTINEQPGSASVVQGVSETIGGIGYSGIGYRTAGVKVLKLAKEEGGELVEANGANASNGTYPLARFLYLAINKNPNEELAPLDREFLKMVLSKQGQEVVHRDGFVPLPAEVVEAEMERLGIK